MTTQRSGRRLPGIRLHRAALLLTPLLWCGTTAAVYAPSAAAQAPTCQGATATIVGTSEDDTLVGTRGDDVIVGGGGLDTISGGPGDDVICGGPTRYEEDEGDPVYQTLDGGDGDDTVVGGSGDDYVFGSWGTDELIGNRGMDYMAGDGFVGPRAGADTMRGGPGADSLSGDGAADRIFGGAGPDYIDDYDGANRLHGGDGADLFFSGPGDEQIAGGPGPDTVSYTVLLEEDGSSSHCNDITADLGRGTARGTGFGTDALDGVESVWTAGGNDVLVGDEGPNVFYTGGYPCDEQAPMDSVTGRGGADRITFDGEDKEFTSAPGPVHVDLAAHLARWRNQDSSLPSTSITLRSVESVTGTEFADVILGDAGPNRLSGGPYYSAGDVISGRRGADSLFGRGGSDRLLGGSGTDELLGRRGADRLSGQRGDDRLYGGGGADELLGGLGADLLDGGIDHNVNDGGRGIDTCRRPRDGESAARCER